MSLVFLQQAGPSGGSPQLCRMGTDPSRAPAALPGAGGAAADAVWQSHHQDRNLVGSLR